MMKYFEYVNQGVIIHSNEQLSYELQLNYLSYFQKQYGAQMIEELILTFDGDDVHCICNLTSVPFERIRRITGYLVGTLDRFNNGKRAEEHDRIKHRIT